MAEVGLQIAQLVVARGKYLRHGQLPPSEVTRKVNERVVFVAAGADDTDDRLALPVNNPVVLPVAATGGYSLCRDGLLPCQDSYNAISFSFKKSFVVMSLKDDAPVMQRCGYRLHA